MGKSQYPTMRDDDEQHGHTCVEEIVNSIIEDAKEIKSIWRKYHLGCRKVKELTKIKQAAEILEKGLEDLKRKQ